MASLEYFAYKGVGVENRKTFHYSQAVRVPPNRIECAGQGGWNPDNNVIDPDLDTQIDQAFANVDLNIKDAGGKGWSQVYSVKSYHCPLNDAAMAAMVRNMKKWLPDHQPIWTVIGVTNLALPEMKVEIDVSCYDDAAEAKTT